jgi:hypothetical protein
MNQLLSCHVSGLLLLKISSPMHPFSVPYEPMRPFSFSNYPPIILPIIIGYTAIIE